MHIYNVFGKRKDVGGNLMAISEVPENPMDSGIPVTVVISPSEQADVRFRFFYPDSKEAPICGHALLGAASHIAQAAFRVETGAGISDVRKSGDVVSVSMALSTAVTPDFTGQPEPGWFGLEASQILSAGIFSAGKPKWCIELKDISALNAVRFDLDTLAAWNHGKNFSGYVLYVSTGDGWHARASNPLYNIPEDPACAVCCAALPLPLEQPAFVHMGYPEYPNLIHLEATEGQLWVGGKVYRYEPSGAV
ncbi:PhzF family phenazine biosynthesis protein [Photobacterium sp. CAU 1568]|uniref:PhzF family phenazine biosynthesis protein n=1 Tax=Photobacterium arenosum TaxID=2774143 RepID=A0ABR9BNF7_9GAMM|nr:PhzF family phenazine biosynthesis protein [Photobacterium arenosum]MBD8514083.1 PhzF family phenazine biosynthesis protein [Photobacterium arenosum]